MIISSILEEKINEILLDSDEDSDELKGGIKYTTFSNGVSFSTLSDSDLSDTFITESSSVQKNRSHLECNETRKMRVSHIDDPVSILYQQLSLPEPLNFNEILETVSERIGLNISNKRNESPFLVNQDTQSSDSVNSRQQKSNNTLLHYEPIDLPIHEKRVSVHMSADQNRITCLSALYVTCDCYRVDEARFYTKQNDNEGSPESNNNHLRPVSFKSPSNSMRPIKCLNESEIVAFGTTNGDIIIHRPYPHTIDQVEYCISFPSSKISSPAAMPAITDTIRLKVEKSQNGVTRDHEEESVVCLDWSPFSNLLLSGFSDGMLALIELTFPCMRRDAENEEKDKSMFFGSDIQGSSERGYARENTYISPLADKMNIFSNKRHSVKRSGESHGGGLTWNLLRHFNYSQSMIHDAKFLTSTDHIIVSDIHGLVTLLTIKKSILGLNVERIVLVDYTDTLNSTSLLHHERSGESSGSTPSNFTMNNDNDIPSSHSKDRLLCESFNELPPGISLCPLILRTRRFSSGIPKLIISSGFTAIVSHKEVLVSTIYPKPTVVYRIAIGKVKSGNEHINDSPSCCWLTNPVCLCIASRGCIHFISLKVFQGLDEYVDVYDSRGNITDISSPKLGTTEVRLGFLSVHKYAPPNLYIRIIQCVNNHTNQTEQGVNQCVESTHITSNPHSTDEYSRTERMNSGTGSRFTTLPGGSNIFCAIAQVGSSDSNYEVLIIQASMSDVEGREIGISVLYRTSIFTVDRIPDLLTVSGLGGVIFLGRESHGTQSYYTNIHIGSWIEMAHEVLCRSSTIISSCENKDRGQSSARCNLSRGIHRSLCDLVSDPQTPKQKRNGTENDRTSPSQISDIESETINLEIEPLFMHLCVTAIIGLCSAYASHCSPLLDAIDPLIRINDQERDYHESRIRYNKVESILCTLLKIYTICSAYHLSSKGDNTGASCTVFLDLPVVATEKYSPSYQISRSSSFDSITHQARNSDGNATRFNRLVYSSSPIDHVRFVTDVCIVGELYKFLNTHPLAFYTGIPTEPQIRSVNSQGGNSSIVDYSYSGQVPENDLSTNNSCSRSDTEDFSACKSSYIDAFLKNIESFMRNNKLDGRKLSNEILNLVLDRIVGKLETSTETEISQHDLTTDSTVNEMDGVSENSTHFHPINITHITDKRTIINELSSSSSGEEYTNVNQYVNRKQIHPSREFPLPCAISDSSKPPYDPELLCLAERICISFDFSKISVQPIIQLTTRYRLYIALIYIYNNIVGEFLAPIEIIANDLLPHSTRLPRCDKSRHIDSKRDISRPGKDFKYQSTSFSDKECSLPRYRTYLNTLFLYVFCSIRELSFPVSSFSMEMPNGISGSLCNFIFSLRTSSGGGHLVSLLKLSSKSFFNAIPMDHQTRDKCISAISAIGISDDIQDRSIFEDVLPNYYIYLSLCICESLKPMHVPCDAQQLLEVLIDYNELTLFISTVLVFLEVESHYVDYEGLARTLAKSALMCSNATLPCIQYALAFVLLFCLRLPDRYLDAHIRSVMIQNSICSCIDDPKFIYRHWIIGTGLNRKGCDPNVNKIRNNGIVLDILDRIKLESLNEAVMRVIDDIVAIDITGTASLFLNGKIIFGPTSDPLFSKLSMSLEQGFTLNVSDTLNIPANCHSTPNLESLSPPCIFFGILFSDSFKWVDPQSSIYFRRIHAYTYFRLLTSVISKLKSIERDSNDNHVRTTVRQNSQHGMEGGTNILMVQKRKISGERSKNIISKDSYDNQSVSIHRSLRSLVRGHSDSLPIQDCMRILEESAVMIGHAFLYEAIGDIESVVNTLKMEIQKLTPQGSEDIFHDLVNARDASELNSERRVYLFFVIDYTVDIFETYRHVLSPLSIFPLLKEFFTPLIGSEGDLDSHISLHPKQRGVFERVVRLISPWKTGERGLGSRMSYKNLLSIYPEIIVSLGSEILNSLIHSYSIESSLRTLENADQDYTCKKLSEASNCAVFFGHLSCISCETPLVNSVISNMSTGTSFSHGTGESGLVNSFDIRCYTSRMKRDGQSDLIDTIFHFGCGHIHHGACCALKTIEVGVGSSVIATCTKCSL